jgi:hypothetical protein
MPKTFNLWSAPWINTDKGCLPMSDVIFRANEIRYIWGHTSLETFGILRLLTAAVQDIEQPQSQRAVADILKNQTFTASRIATWAGQYAERLDLFGDRPFLQAVAEDIPAALLDDKDYKASFPSARIAIDIPTGESVTRDGRGENDHLFCPACAARALTVPGPWYSSGGNGLAKSINGVPPLYAVPGGSNLLEVLARSLVWPDVYPDNIGYDDPLVPWRYDGFHKKEQERSKPSLLHGLLFLPRRLRLYPEPGPDVCTRCGQKTDTPIARVHFTQGERFSQGDDRHKFADPFVVNETRSKKNGESWLQPVQVGKVRGWHEIILGMVKGHQSLAMQPWDIPTWQYFGTATTQAKYHHWFSATCTRPSRNISDALTFTESLIGFTAKIAARAILGPDAKPQAVIKKQEFLRREMWQLVYQPFQPALADDCPENMIPWEQAVIDLVLDLHYRKTRHFVSLDTIARNELALMAWVRDNRKWYQPAEAELETGIGWLLKKRGMKPGAFASLLEGSATQARETLKSYGIDPDEERTEKALRAWNSPRQITQRVWLRDYFYQPKKNKE